MSAFEFAGFRASYLSLNDLKISLSSGALAPFLSASKNFLNSSIPILFPNCLTSAFSVTGSYFAIAVTINLF